MIEHDRKKDQTEVAPRTKISIASGTPMARVFLTEQK